MPRTPSFRARMGALLAVIPASLFAQGLSPGPYEILPFNDAYIIEAFTDLIPTTNQIADWTGWTATQWESPNAYDNHGGTDFSVGTGTPCLAITTGTVIAIENGVPENDHATSYYGNYVKIQPDGKSPLGENLAVLTAHMLPNILVSVGDRVNAGQLIGYTDNSGNSTSEHCHVESSILPSNQILCGFYNAHYKYPIMLNPTATFQLGHVLRVKNTAKIRSDRFVTSPEITEAAAGQLLYASFAKRGHYRVFIPNNASNRSGWIAATEVDEVFEGTVIQPLPDAGPYVHTQHLAAPYKIYASAAESAAQIGSIYYAGGRFVADQTAPGGWYRVAVPSAGAAVYGWVKANNRMVVYPELVNPTINLALRPNSHFPIVNNFNTLGQLDYGRPKFDRRDVVAFSPASPTGDGRALLLTDHGNTGNGHNESVSYGRPEHRDYYAEVDVYLRYRPSYGGAWTGYEQYGLFLRDDGFGGFDETFEGKGNAYLIMYNSKTGKITCGKAVDAAITDLAPGSPTTITTNGWRKMRIEAEGRNIRYYLDGVLKASVTDTTFPSGLCGINYTARLGSYPSGRGAYFDNFRADVLPGASVADWSVY